MFFPTVASDVGIFHLGSLHFGFLIELASLIRHQGIVSIARGTERHCLLLVSYTKVCCPFLALCFRRNDLHQFDHLAVFSFKGDNEDQTAGIQIVLKAIESPVRQIVANAGGSPDVVVNEILNGKNNFGYDAGFYVILNI